MSLAVQEFQRDTQAALERAYRKKQNTYRIDGSWNNRWDVDFRKKTKSGEHLLFDMKVDRGMHPAISRGCRRRR